MMSNLPIEFNFTLGWICPQCRSVMSPTMVCCIRCTGYTIEKNNLEEHKKISSEELGKYFKDEYFKNTNQLYEE